MAKQTLLAWSTGKDSAWTLHRLHNDPRYQVVSLLTTVGEADARIPMHGVPRMLLERQARAVGLPLRIVELPDPCPNEAYERLMGEAIRAAKRDGVDCMAFGDLHLEDVRRYREERLGGGGLDLVFPLWGLATEELARRMVASGLRALITCVDPRHLSSDYLGRELDDSFLNELPEGVDPCGENGEFHTFVFDGPMFGSPVPVRADGSFEQKGFLYARVVALDRKDVPP